jgi:rRNA maturation protein Nop10
MTVPGCGSATYINQVQVNQSPGLIATSNSPVCAGRPIYLNATASEPLFSVTWTGPNGYSVTSLSPGISLATPAMSGVYTATANVPGCGGIPATTSVVVNPSISSVVITGSSSLCVGQNLTLTATEVNSASYLWQGPGGFTAATRQVIRNAVNTSMAGTYSLFVTQSGCGATRMLMQSVNIFNTAAPTASIVNSPSCVGNAVFLNSTNVPGATSFRWDGPNSFVSTAQNASISNVQMNRNGVYTLTVTHPTCGSFTTSVSLIVNPVSNNYMLVANTPGCIGSTLSLSSTLPTGGTATHLWRAPNGATYSTRGISIPNAQSADAGTYTYTVNSPNCGTNTRTLRFVINDPTVVTATANGPLCIGQAAYFNATGPVGTTYSWSGPSAYVSSFQSASRSTVQLAHAGVYTLNATVPACGVVTRTANLVVNPCRTSDASIDATQDGVVQDAFNEAVQSENVLTDNQEKLNSLKVYPNPFRDELNLIWSDMKVFSLKLYDLNGKVLIEAEPGEGFEYHIEVNDLPSGVYLLAVQTSAGPISYRVTRL